MNRTLDVASLDAAWRTRWPEVRPIGHELRSSAHRTWVRFHSLRGSKRYADNDAEYDELLSRHFTVLRDLNTSVPTDELFVVTNSWSELPDQAERAPELVSAFPPGTFWQSVPYHLDIPEDPAWKHLFVGGTTLDSPDLRALLLLVADDGARDVIICPPSAQWLYHPYDGGADVIAPEQSTVDALRNRYAGWLSRHPKGL